jgi:hypothetical protein
MGPEDSRRFNDEEVALIIKRAAELQHTEQKVAQEQSNAMSLVEIEQVAREAGIDPQLIRRAAQGLDTPLSVNRPSPWAGSPTRLVFERVVDGEVPVEEFESLVNEMRRTFGENGVPSVLGRTLAWSSVTTSGPRGSQRGRAVDVSVTVRGGITTIRVEEELRNLATSVFAPMVIGLGSASAGLVFPLAIAVQSAPVAGGIMVATVGALYAGARAVFGRITGKRERQLRQLLDRLESMAGHAVTRTQSSPATGISPTERA